MIPRYSRKEMSDIWSDQSRFEIWLEVETLALEGMVNEGLAPQESLDAVRNKASFTPERVFDLEKEVKHDVIAFLTCIAESVGPEARYLHRGMTSSDLLDTAFAVQLKKSGELILADIDSVLESIQKRAEEYKHTPCIGRSHGIHAEPTSFGIKLISWYAEINRQKKRFQAALEDVSVGKIAGAVGTYASITPTIEQHVMDALGLKPETVASQIVHRDRHANFFCALAQLGSSIERACVEIRHLQRTEVREACEEFSKGQKGSSAMPHKKNPILTENLTGLARLLRSHAQAALENVALWHERDISHSSVERVIAPDATVLADFMLQRFKKVVDGLVVFEDRLKENLELTRGTIYSGTLLLALVDNGMVREDAYKKVQEHSLAAWEGGKTLEERVFEDSEITQKIPEERLKEVFDLKRHLAQVDLIFQRALE